MKRPIGVTVVAMLAIVGGTYRFIQSLFWIRSFSETIGNLVVFGEPKTWWFVLAVGIAPVLSIISIAVGIGLWKLRRWARLLLIVFSVLALGTVSLVFILGPISVDFWLRNPWPLLLPVALYGFCLAYMFTDEVKRAFSA